MGFGPTPKVAMEKTNLLLPFVTIYGARHPLDAHQTAVQEKSRTRLLLELALVQDDQGPHQVKTGAHWSPSLTLENGRTSHTQVLRLTDFSFKEKLST